MPHPDPRLRSPSSTEFRHRCAFVLKPSDALRRCSGLVVLLFALALPSAIAAHEPPTPGGIAPPRLVLYAEPVYPDEARAAHAGGDVVLSLEIAPTGEVVKAEVLKGAGHGLDEAARDAVLKFRFEPAHGPDGTPIAAIIQYTQHFEPAPGPVEEQAAPAALPPPPKKFESTTTAERPPLAASAVTIDEREISVRPHATPTQLLRDAPGLVTAQHAGGGKADQLFLRGFDADHGTDVALFVDDVPVNMPSHGHGQGYADLHWLIPELVGRIDVKKGPYFAELGDFATAGAVVLHTRDTFDESQVSLLGGQFETFRALAIAAPRFGASHPLLAAEVAGTNGPFVTPQGLRRFNLFAKESVDVAGGHLAVLASAYGAQWTASGQVPERWVGCTADGCISRFGSIDPTEGGNTQRQMLSATWATRSGPDDVSLSAYVVRYRLSLFSNFTFERRDPVHGDEINQTDDRVFTRVTGRFRHEAHAGPVPLWFTLGASARLDSIDAELVQAEKRQRLDTCFGGPGPCFATRTRQSNLAAFGTVEAEPWHFLRLQVGLRADLFEWDVTDLRTAAERTGPEASGIAQQGIVSPKFAAEVRLPFGTALFADAGAGFHSNDSRAAVSSGGEGALARALGTEVGVRTRQLHDRLQASAAAWLLHLSGELVWNGDEGTTEPSGPSTRRGVDLDVRWYALEWLFAAVDLSLAQPRFDDGAQVPLAPRTVLSAGLGAKHANGLSGGVWLRHIGARPANEEGTVVAQGYTVLDALAAWRFRAVELGLLVENVADADWREAQFDDVSQIRRAPYSEPAPVEEIHFTPGNPRNFQGYVTVFF